MAFQGLSASKPKEESRRETGGRPEPEATEHIRNLTTLPQVPKDQIWGIGGLGQVVLKVFFFFWGGGGVSECEVCT